jgi:hypothetical protein
MLSGFTRQEWGVRGYRWVTVHVAHGCEATFVPLDGAPLALGLELGLELGLALSRQRLLREA